MALEVSEANLGAVNYHKVVLEEVTPEPQPEEPVVKRCQRKRQRQIAEKEEEVGRRRAEDLREAHSAEQGEKDVSRRKRAHPTAGEKSILQEHSQQQAVKSIANSRLKRRRTMSRRKMLDR